MRVLIVDDDPYRHRRFNTLYGGHNVTHAYKYSDAIRELKDERFDVVQLDHDLADHQEPEYTTSYGMYGSLKETLTGFHVAQFIAYDLERKLRPGKVIVHSINSDGAENIFACLDKNGIEVSLCPFTSLFSL